MVCGVERDSRTGWRELALVTFPQKARSGLCQFRANFFAVCEGGAELRSSPFAPRQAKSRNEIVLQSLRDFAQCSSRFRLAGQFRQSFTRQNFRRHNDRRLGVKDEPANNADQRDEDETGNEHISPVSLPKCRLYFTIGGSKRRQDIGVGLGWERGSKKNEEQKRPTAEARPAYNIQRTTSKTGAASRGP